MSNSPFTIHVKTPFGETRIEAGTWEGLVKLMPASVEQAMPGGVQDEAFEARVKALYEAFKKRFIGVPSRTTSIETHGLEVDLVRCFLRRMTICQAVNWLENHKSFKTSKTVVGRYWKRFFLLGFKRDTVSNC
jgi:hypothetical protein